MCVVRREQKSNGCGHVAGAAKAPALRIRYGAESGPGACSENEDAVEIIVPSLDDPRAARGALFAVADGMGGHAAGAVASRTAADCLAREYYAAPMLSPGHALVRGTLAAHAELVRVSEAMAPTRGMGTTLVAAVIGDGLTVSNVGDSRAYLCNADTMDQVSEDHSHVAAQVRAGLMTREAARRSPFRCALTQCVGVGEPPEVDTFWLPLHPGDLVLLCTDGLVEQLRPEEIEEVLRETPEPGSAARRLTGLALERDTRDNITVVCIRVEGED
jgi:PPM family protein phosphatase